MISRLKNQVQDVLDSDAVLESMSEAEKQITLAKAKLVKNIPAITASLKLLIEIMIWITVSFTALWTMQKIALRREFNRQLGEFIWVEFIKKPRLKFQNICILVYESHIIS